MSQLEIEFAPTESTKLRLRDLSFGQLFRISKAPHPVYMKVKSVNFLNNSTLLSDVFARGDCLVVDVRKGTVHVHSGEAIVVKLTGNLKVREEQ